MTFEQLGITAPILKALKEEGYTTPTPIQQKSIPILLNKHDLLGCAQTGTGKTAAFSIPILQHLHLADRQGSSNNPVRALIVTPTRELAIQIGESLSTYGKYTRVKHAVVFGGVSQFLQEKALKERPEILVATPGRLLDLINQGFIRLDQLEYFVLDEADRMLDMGFVHDVKRIIKLLPAKRQSLFFSATMPISILELASSMLTDPERVEVTPVSSTAEQVAQQVFMVDQLNKSQLLLHVLQSKNTYPVLVFTRTKHGADKVVKFLHRSGISAAAIHGNKSQNSRQTALQHFKEGKIKVLVATDIAARGIDIEMLPCVINYEIPNIPETYVHRIGRTGRAGNSGTALSFCDILEVPYLWDIQKLTKITIPVTDHPYKATQTAPVVLESAPKGYKKPIAQPGNSTNNNPRKKGQWFKKNKGKNTQKSALSRA